MNVKEWLSRAYKIDQQITSKQEQIERWRSLAEKISSVPNGPRVQGGAGDNRVESYCIKIADAELDIKRQLDDLVTIKKEISDMINQLPDYAFRVLLEQRYLLCKSWEDIASFMEYSVRHVTKSLHPKALHYIEAYIRLAG